MTGARKGFAIGTVAFLFLAVAATGAFAQVVEGSSANAYGFSLRTDLFDTNVLPDSIPIGNPYPMAKAPDSTQQNPNKTSASFIGPIRIPEDSGELLSDVSVLKVSAERITGDLPTSHGEAHTTHVFLFEQDGKPQIAVNAVDAVADAKCTAPGKAAITPEGSQLLGVSLGGEERFDLTPDENTNITRDLNYTGDPATTQDDMALKVILNEVIRSDAGTGITVNMIHVIGYALNGTGLGAYVDLVIGHAQANVFCGDETPASDDNKGDDGGPVVIDKVVTSTTFDPAGATDGTTAEAHQGDDVTWQITITNKGENACGVATVTDTLPDHFTFVRSSGDLDKPPGTRIQNGQDIQWSNGAKYDLGPGKTLTQAVTAKVADDAPFGTYTNLVNATGTCSQWSQGLRGPVDVVPTTAVRGARQQRALPATGELARTGIADLTSMLMGMVLLLSTGVGMRSIKR